MDEVDDEHEGEDETDDDVRRSTGLGGRSALVLATIFPVGAERDRSRRDAWVAVGVAAGVAILLILRAPFKFDQFWAEDGQVFLDGAVNHGRLTSLGSWYAGYLHTIPRLLGEVAASLPLRFAPAVFFVGVVVATAAGSGLVMYRSSAYVGRVPVRILLACVPAILPTMGAEVIGNAANLQFLLVYFAFWLLLWFPRTRLTAAVGAISALLIALSTMLVVFLVPVAVARLVARRGRRALATPSALLAGIAIQVIGRTLAGAARSDLGMEPADLARAVGAFDRMVVANVRPPLSEPAAELVASILVGVSVAIVLAVTFVPGTGTARSAIRPAVARAMVVVSLGLGLAIWFTLAFVVGVASRYGVLVSFFLITGLVVAVDFVLDARPTLAVRVPACILLVAFTLSVFRGWQPWPWHDEVDRSWSQTISEAQTSCRTTGAAWAQLPLSPRTWAVFLPCDRLLDGT